MKRIILLSIIVLGVASLAFLLYQLRQMNPINMLPERKPDRVVQTHSIVLEKIEELGKLELVKYQFQDMVSHEVVREWLPDPKVILFVSGQVVGCVDFSKVDSTSIVVETEKVYVYLPEPEICYAKIDHENSRVYDTRYTFFQTAELVDAAYLEAEKEIMNAAKRVRIEDQTREQARIMLVPLLSTLTEKDVVLQFPGEVPNLKREFPIDIPSE